MRILLINHYAGSPQHGMEFRPYFMAREWIKAGHQVRIVAASESHVRSKDIEIDGSISRERIDDIEYLWLKTPPYQGNGVARAINIFTFVWQLYRHADRILENFDTDAVIASSTYPLDIHPARRLAKKADARLIWEVHDLWPLSPIELSGMSPWHPFILLMQHAENRACRISDKVVSMLPHTDQHLVRHGMSRDKFVYVPNGIHADAWDIDETQLPTAHTKALDALRASGDMLVGYTGAHGLANALHHLIRAAQMTRDLPISYVLVGHGPEKEALQAEARELGLDKIHFLGSVPKTAIPTLLDKLDLLYIGLQRQSLFRFGISPNKLMDYMMAGKPVIQAIKAGNDLVTECGCGLTITPEAPDAIADAVRQLHAMDPAEREKMGANGRRYVSTQHDYPTLADKFLEALKP